jgi:hypothetical protein
MPAVKIGPKHQITIPKEVYDSLHLTEGCFPYKENGRARVCLGGEGHTGLPHDISNQR